MDQLNQIKDYIQNKSFEELFEDKNVYVKQDQHEKNYILINSKNKNFEYYKFCNGNIYCKDTNKFVCVNMNKMTDITFNQLKNMFNEEDSIIEYCEDGTVIRVYYDNTKGWRFSTNKCIDAFSSYWTSSKSFGEMFDELFDEKMYDMLNKEYTYIFILRHKDNRIVIDHSENEIVYVMKINNVTKHEDYTNDFKYYENIKTIVKINDIKDMNGQPIEFIKFDINKDWEKINRNDKRGIIIRKLNKDTNTYDLYKYEFEEYKNISKIRGNVPSLIKRYTQLYKNKEMQKQLTIHYPRMTAMFNIIDEKINVLSCDLYKIYVDTHIYRKYILENTNKYYKTIKMIHKKFKEGEKITIDVVNKVLEEIPTYILEQFVEELY
mgnify:CR=1 FL=1